MTCAPFTLLLRYANSRGHGSMHFDIETKVLGKETIVRFALLRSVSK